MRKRLLLSLAAATLMVAGCDKFKPSNPFGPSGVSGSEGNNSSSHNYEEVWFTPNIGSTDLADMFTKSDLWPIARKNMTAFSFYGQHLKDVVCDMCGPNTLARLREVDAFRFLAKNNIKIAIETGSLKEFNCNNIGSTIDEAAHIIVNVRESGGQVAYIAMASGKLMHSVFLQKII